MMQEGGFRLCPPPFPIPRTPYVQVPPPSSSLDQGLLGLYSKAFKRNVHRRYFAADDMPTRDLPVPLYKDLWSDSLQASG